LGLKITQIKIPRNAVDDVLWHVNNMTPHPCVCMKTSSLKCKDQMLFGFNFDNIYLKQVCKEDILIIFVDCWK